MITQTAIETTASTQQFYLNGTGIVNDEPETINKIPGNRQQHNSIFHAQLFPCFPALIFLSDLFAEKLAQITSL